MTKGVLTLSKNIFPSYYLYLHSTECRNLIKMYVLCISCRYVGQSVYKSVDFVYDSVNFVYDSANFFVHTGERLSPLQAGVMPGDRTKSVRSLILCIQVEKHRKRDERSTDRVTFTLLYLITRSLKWR